MALRTLTFSTHNIYLLSLYIYKVMPSTNQISFLDAVKLRRSIVAVNKTSSIPNERIVSIVQDAIKHAPSAFSVDSCRAVVLFGDEHEKLWDITMKHSKDTMPPPVYTTVEGRIQGHRASYGTVRLNVEQQSNSLIFVIITPYRCCSLKTPLL